MLYDRRGQTVPRESHSSILFLIIIVGRGRNKSSFFFSSAFNVINILRRKACVYNLCYPACIAAPELQIIIICVSIFGNFGHPCYILTTAIKVHLITYINT
jgi:hypothetical protein